MNPFVIYGLTGIAATLGTAAAASAVALPFFASVDAAMRRRWFTTVPEGYARQINHNDSFHQLVMSWTNHRFRGPVDQTDIDRAIREASVLEADIDVRNRQLGKVQRELFEAKERAQKIAELEQNLDDAIQDNRTQDAANAQRDLAKERQGFNPDITGLEETCNTMEEELNPLKERYSQLVIPHPWDVVYDQGDHRGGFLAEFYRPFGDTMRGNHLIGIPAFYKVHSKHFTWLSWELAQKQDGTTEKIVRYHDEKAMQHILLQQDVYVVEVKGAETNDGIPINAPLLLTIQIENPYKALNDVQQWLEATTNQIEADITRYIGTKTFEEIYRAGQASKKDASDPINDELRIGMWRQIHICRNQYGARILQAQFLNPEPADDRGRNLRELLLASTIAEREGDANIVKMTKAAIALQRQTDGDTYRIRKIAEAREEENRRVIAPIANNPLAVEAFKWDRLSRVESPITVYAGGNTPLAINVPQSAQQGSMPASSAQQNSPNSQPSTPTQGQSGSQQSAGNSTKPVPAPSNPPPNQPSGRRGDKGKRNRNPRQ